MKKERIIQIKPVSERKLRRSDYSVIKIIKNLAKQRRKLMEEGVWIGNNPQVHEQAGSYLNNGNDILSK